MESIKAELRREFERYNEAFQRVTGRDTSLSDEHLETVIRHGDPAEMEAYRQRLRAGRAEIVEATIAPPPEE